MGFHTRLKEHQIHYHAKQHFMLGTTALMAESAFVGDRPAVPHLDRARLWAKEMGTPILFSAQNRNPDREPLSADARKATTP